MIEHNSDTYSLSLLSSSEEAGAALLFPGVLTSWGKGVLRMVFLGVVSSSDSFATLLPLEREGRDMEKGGLCSRQRVCLCSLCSWPGLPIGLVEAQRDSQVQM